MRFLSKAARRWLTGETDISEPYRRVFIKRLLNGIDLLEEDLILIIDKFEFGNSKREAILSEKESIFVEMQHVLEKIKSMILREMENEKLQDVACG